ncbi:MAG: DUF429 domain-containing protein [Deltaproteobacteria bacterium]|nr:DUF429 domain-containing protein [Deltaproteobacteria bacterium]
MIDIIGIDCSTNDKSVAVAVGRWGSGRTSVHRVVVCGGSAGRAADVILSCFRSGAPTLLAIDAPLGWPVALAQSLIDHTAGVGIPADPNRLFRRDTDRIVKAMVNQQPLDVGADRIARTAHWALGLLEELRTRSGKSIPLAWNAKDVTTLTAIEVYPAATLTSRGIAAKAYKKKEQQSARGTLLGALAGIMVLPDVAVFAQCADAIDAAVCVLAGADFINGLCIMPIDAAVAKREGWIWVRSPELQTEA